MFSKYIYETGYFCCCWNNWCADSVDRCVERSWWSIWPVKHACIKVNLKLNKNKIWPVKQYLKYIYTLENQLVYFKIYSPYFTNLWCVYVFLLFILGCFVCFLDFMQLCLRKQQGSSLRAGGECRLWPRSIGAIDRWRHSAYTHGKILKKASTVSRCTHSDTYNQTIQRIVPFMLILSGGSPGNNLHSQ